MLIKVNINLKMYSFKLLIKSSTVAVPASCRSLFRRRYISIFKKPLRSISMNYFGNINSQKTDELIFNTKMSTPPSAPECNKVTIVGCGNIGMACASAITIRGIASEVCLLNNAVSSRGLEAKDLCDALTLLHQGCCITETDSIKETSGSKVIVFTAGHVQKQGQSSLELANSNLNIIKLIIPSLIEINPKAVLIIATTPVDIMSLAAWKITQLPLQKVIGSGCELESARFKILLSEKLNLPKENINAWIIGEHGRSGICHWSSASFAGIPLMSINTSIGMPWDLHGWDKLQIILNKISDEIVGLKGYTNWGEGMAIASIVQSVLRNDNNIKSISTMAKGRYEIDEEVFMSFPCTVGERGIGHMVNLPMSLVEQEQLILSAKNIESFVKKLKI